MLKMSIAAHFVVFVLVAVVSCTNSRINLIAGATSCKQLYEAKK